MVRPGLALVVVLAACTPERSAPVATPQASAPAAVTSARVQAASEPAAVVPAAASEPAVAATTSGARMAATVLTGDELLVLRGPAELPWQGLRRSASEPSYVHCELDAAEGREHLELLRGEIRVVAREYDGRVGHRCEVVRVDERYARGEHPIRPLTRDHLGELALGVAPAEQVVAWIADADAADPDLTKGPLRAVVGRSSGVVVFASAYLGDLGDHFAVPQRPLLTRAELEADLVARRAAGTRVGRLGGAHHFAPQVASGSERLAFSKLAVLSVTAAEDRYQDRGPTGVGVWVGGEARYVMFQSYMMKASWEAAFRRGRVIERVVEDGAAAHP